jgi:hypothetical protein
MATKVNDRSQQQILVEHLRSTGYEGREPWVAAIDPVRGTRVVAIRQMEACATHPACAWRDEVDHEVGLWRFMRECLLEPLLSLAEIVEATIRQQPAGVDEDAEGTDFFDVAWKTVWGLLQRLQTADPATTSYAETSIRFLIAVMALRQIVDGECRPGMALRDEPFVPHSTNVHATLLPSLMRKLGSTILDLSGPIRLIDVCLTLERSSSGNICPSTQLSK